MSRDQRPVRRSAALHAVAARGRNVPVTGKIGPALAVLLALLLGAGIASFRTSRRVVENEEAVRRSSAIRGAVSDVLLAATGYESAARGFVITGEPRHLDPYADAPARCRARLAALRTLTAPDPSQGRRLERLAPAVEAKLAWVDNLVATRRAAGAEAGAALVRSDRGRRLMDDVRAIAGEMDEAEARALSARAAAHASAARRAETFVAIGTALDAVLVAGVVLVLRRDVTGRRRAEAALREMATVDPLTGLLNRRGFLEFGAEHVGLAGRFGRPVGLFFADLDGLKAINDRFGHPEGDRALVAAARALRATFRASDVLGRWSGDEFVMLAVLDSAADVARIAARLEKKVAELNGSGELPFALSLSVGAMTSNGEGSIPDLVAHADAAMYREKQRRRASRSGD